MRGKCTGGATRRRFCSIVNDLAPSAPALSKNEVIGYKAQSCKDRSERVWKKWGGIVNSEPDEECCRCIMAV
jgi:hypothetical protein